MKDVYISIIVIVSGAAVLALELIGTRILGPYYGVSLFLWSSLITVTLAALSTGYLVGGIIADRKCSLSILSGSVGIAGCWISVIPWLRDPFLHLFEPVGLRVAVLFSSVILFYLPLMCLGLVSPYAIKLRATGLETLGRVSGNLYALSTVAGVVSALVTGFYLIPSFGIERLTLSVGLMLMFVAAIGFLLEKRTISSIILIVIFIGILLGALPSRHEAAEGLLALEQSPYAEVRVLDTDRGRHLLIDGGIHSLVDTSTWNSTLPYCAVMDIPKKFFSQPGTVLLIGLGGGSLVKQYSESHWKIETVEIDPQVASLAIKYFNLRPDECTIRIADGRRFLTTAPHRYDVILLDAFGSSSIPFHLITAEAFRLIASHLSDNGVFAMNIETIGWNDPLVKNLAATLQQAFQTILVLPIVEPPDNIGNIILLGAQRKLEPVEIFRRNVNFDPEWRFGSEYQQVHAWDNKFVPDIGEGIIFTDDKNPIDLRAESINYLARQDLHHYFGGRAPLTW